MSHLVKVFLYELRRNLRRRGYLFTTFGVPLLAFLLVFGYQLLTRGDSPAPVGINSNNMDEIMELLPNPNARVGVADLAGVVEPSVLPEVVTLFTDEASALAAIESGEIVGFYRVPEDYLETGDVTMVIPRLNLSLIDTGPIRTILRASLANRAAEQGVDPDVIARLESAVQFDEDIQILTTSQDGETAGTDTRFIIVYIFTITLLMSLFVTNGYLLQSVIEEKENRLIEILISSMRPVHLLGGKILAYGLLGLIQVGVWVGAVLLGVQLAGGAQFAQTLGALANLSLPLDILPLLILYFVLAYLLFAGLYGVVGALSNSMREGPQYAVFFTLPAALPLYFITIYVQSPEGPLAVITSIFPLTAPIAMTMRLVISAVPTWQIIVSLAVLALSVVGSMWLAGRMFRVQTLLAGQPPKLRELPKLLRG